MTSGLKFDYTVQLQLDIIPKLKGDDDLTIFTVSFFGHRQIDDPFTIEDKLERLIRELLTTKEYVEFLSDVTASSISLLLQLYADANEPSVMTTAHLFWCYLIQPQNTATMRNHSMSITMRSRFVPNLLQSILSLHTRPGIVRWLIVHILSCSVWITNLEEPTQL